MIKFDEKLNYMEAIIKVPSSEFTEELFKKIAALLKGKNAEVTIAVHDNEVLDAETNDQFWKRLDKSIENIESGNAQKFSMAELNAFINQ